MTPRARNDRGFTLIEVMISLGVFGVLLAAAFTFMSAQNRAFRNGLEKLTGMQTLRFTLAVLEEDIATAGTNVPGGQPPLVYAGEDVVAFTADYVTRASSDPFAVFHDPDVPAGQASSPTSKIRLPGTSFSFPDTVYMVGSTISPAEMITFFFEKDTTTTRDDDYALMRQVNGAAPELVSRQLLLPEGGEPVFRYLRHTGEAIDSFPDAALPLAHAERFHLSGADTGLVARIDSVVAVRVTLRASNGMQGASEEVVELTRIIRMPNVAGGQLEACGSEPLLGTAITAVPGTTGTGEPIVTLTWGQSTDESGGEGDVVRYVIFRREPPSSVWDEAYLSIPAGQPSYSYVDAGVEPGKTYQYGLAAQDCTPSLSPVSAALPATILP